MTTTSATGPMLIMIRGLPGSGKSYLAQALEQAIGTGNVSLLDPDATDYKSPAYVELSAALTAEGVDAKFHPYRFLRGQAYDAITAGRIIIWNQAFTNLDGFSKTVVNLQAYAADHDRQLPVLVVEVAIDQATARQRVAERAGQGGHDVSAAEFDRFIRDYRSFAGEGYQVVTVNGEAAVAQSVAAVLQAITSLARN